MKRLDYSMPKFHQALVLGAGPSLLENINEVKKFIKKSTLILATTYNFPIKADYTMIVGKSVFREKIVNLRCKKIIITDWVYKNNVAAIKKLEKKKEYEFRIIKTSCKNASQAYWDGDVTIKDGVFAHHLSNCGFTALLACHFFRPEKIMIAGFDGPKNDGFTMPHFNGKTRIQKGIHKDKKISQGKGEFLSKIIKFMNDRGSQIVSFKNDALWGADLTGLNIVQI